MTIWTKNSLPTQSGFRHRNALAREVRALGYDIENRRDVGGRDKRFEIRGLSQEILDKYSRRSPQRDAIKDFSRTRGREPTDNEIAVRQGVQSTALT